MSSEGSNPDIVHCKDLIKIYPSPVEGLKFPALRGIDLQVEKGQLVSIIGPSGAGKTTLLRIIGGFARPSSGEVYVDGTLINNLSRGMIKKIRRNIGIMFQNPRENLIFNLSALKNVTLPMRYFNEFNGNHVERAEELLERVGLKGKEHRTPKELSGGEQQRVAIASALALDPKLLLADEPTGELDGHTTDIIIDYFKDLNKTIGTAIVVATHDRRFNTMTDYTYRIMDGKIVTYDLPEGEQSRLIRARDEYIVIDDRHNIRLPNEIFDRFQGLHSVKISIRDECIELVPYSKNRTRLTLEEED